MPFLQGPVFFLRSWCFFCAEVFLSALCAHGPFFALMVLFLRSKLARGPSFFALEPLAQKKTLERKKKDHERV